MGIFAKLKAQLALIIGVIIGGLMLYINALQKNALRKDLKLQKSKSKQKDKANKALHEGLKDEGTAVKRGYFDK